MGLNPVLAEPCPLGGKGVINPHVTRFHTLDGKTTDVFHVKPVYYEAIDHTWRPMSEVTAFHGNKNIVLKMGWGRMMSQRYFQWLTKRQRLFPGKDLAIEGLVLQPAYYEYATVSTFYPDPHAETTTVDGFLESAYGVWATIRAQTSASVTDSDDAVIYYQSYRDGGGSLLKRHVYLFDTSAIADSDTITDATYSFYAFNTGITDTDGETYHLVTSNPASNTNLVAADYNISNFGSTSLASIALASITINAYNDLTVNGTGLGLISKTGVTKFGHRMGLDISNTQPSTGGNQAPIYTADEAGTSKDLKLVVTHTAGGATFVPRISFIM
jgi:hypothetical protein